MRVAEAIELDAQTERALRALSKGRRVEACVQQRASVILLAAQGWQNKVIAEEVRLDRRQVALWRRRFIEGGIQALLRDATRAGRTPSVTLALESLILLRTLHEPPDDAEQWSTRKLASQLGVSATTVRRVWQRNGIQPHLQDRLPGPHVPSGFEHAVVDAVGAYMSASVRVMVFSCDDQLPAQAVTCTNDIPPKRLSATPLLNALKALEGANLSKGSDHRCREECLRFLRQIHRSTPRHVKLHLIVDHDVLLHSPGLQAWLARHPRWVLHSVPQNISWMTWVQRFVREVLAQDTQSQSFSNVAQFRHAVRQSIARLKKKKPRPFMWVASAAGVATESGGKPALRADAT